METSRKPRKQGRTNLACLRCRSRHAKCNGATPMCRRCRYVGEECVYDQMPNEEDISQDADEDEYLLFKALKAQVDSMGGATAQLALDLQQMHNLTQITAHASARKQALAFLSPRNAVEDQISRMRQLISGAVVPHLQPNHDPKKEEETKSFDWSISLRGGSMRFNTNIRTLQQLQEFFLQNAQLLSPSIPMHIPNNTSIVRSKALWKQYGQETLYPFLELQSSLEKRPSASLAASKSIHRFLASNERFMLNRILRVVYACQPRHFGLMLKFWKDYQSPNPSPSCIILAYALASNRAVHTFQFHSLGWDPCRMGWRGTREEFGSIVANYFFERARDLLSPYILGDIDEETGVKANEDIVEAAMIMSGYLTEAKRREQASLYHAMSIRIAMALGYHTLVERLEPTDRAGASESPPDRNLLLLWSMLVHMDNRYLWRGLPGTIPNRYRNSHSIGWCLLEQAQATLRRKEIHEELPLSKSPWSVDGMSTDSGYYSSSPSSDTATGYELGTFTFTVNLTELTELTERYLCACFIIIDTLAMQIVQTVWSGDEDASNPSPLCESTIHDFDNTISRLQNSIPAELSPFAIDALPSKRACYNALYIQLCFPMVRLDLYKPILPAADTPLGLSTPFSRRAHLICTQAATISTDMIALIQRNRGDVEGAVSVRGDPETGDPDNDALCHSFHLFELSQACDIHIFNLRVGIANPFIKNESGTLLALLAQAGAYLARARRIVVSSMEYHEGNEKATEYAKSLEESLAEFGVPLDADLRLPDPEDSLIKLMMKDDL
ncbi:hypothetical protein BC936DRAFT_148329 [Jimgerdemannia flammicorona]|uniref:Zn(2)-C6 fungal-type domain-containing protein n=1 Tax=Jimgerdemannia flammicorona TaxID=994334 RepID=A0A433D384_9FUNG|nr:hypothetical protein BC936DRAFT_148329 [Jimgerdemannia flammicorona]